MLIICIYVVRDFVVYHFHSNLYNLVGIKTCALSIGTVDTSNILEKVAFSIETCGDFCFLRLSVLFFIRCKVYFHRSLLASWQIIYSNTETVIMKFLINLLCSDLLREITHKLTKVDNVTSTSHSLLQ